MPIISLILTLVLSVLGFHVYTSSAEQAVYTRALSHSYVLLRACQWLKIFMN